ncbi:MAG: tRNA (adenosine(37)-N6)-threonylcarbamoyltransferase complex transferase subunit TsaD, partial [Planctomycetota bacterium]|nr:tRNA (adenosine(37)-N6)-threonylcarbamoyltransferase complex transferase subunit TsaD [Planctomycetota bacterium]
GIETSCDETAAAVVRDGFDVLSSIVASQEDIHRQYGGVVPELASRAHIERITPIIKRALAEAGADLAAIELIGVSNTPGLVGALLVGVSAAKALAVALDKPVVGVNHVLAHAYGAIMWARGQEAKISALGAQDCRRQLQPPTVRNEAAVRFPAVALVVSGGHTSLYRVADETTFDLLGGTMDDAAGEAFDKVAAILGLEYPGGPSIEKAAEKGSPTAIKFPRTYLGRDSLDFSFSGVKTAVLYLCKGRNAQKKGRNITTHSVGDIAASFQEAVVDVLVRKTIQAARRTGARTVLIGGGVAANKRLRARLAEECAEERMPLILPPPAMCTDNAVMVAGLATALARVGRVSDRYLDAVPTWR